MPILGAPDGPPGAPRAPRGAPGRGAGNFPPRAPGGPPGRGAPDGGPGWVPASATAWHRSLPDRMVRVHRTIAQVGDSDTISTAPSVATITVGVRGSVGDRLGTRVVRAGRVWLSQTTALPWSGAPAWDLTVQGGAALWGAPPRCHHVSWSVTARRRADSPPGRVPPRTWSCVTRSKSSGARPGADPLPCGVDRAG